MAQKAKTHRPARSPGNYHSTKPSEEVKTRARGIRATNRWRKLSEAKRRKNPLCEDPFGDHGGRVVACESVHHVKSVEARRNSLGFSQSKLAAAVCLTAPAIAHWESK